MSLSFVRRAWYLSPPPFVVFAAICAASILNAQVAGTISGFVKDPTGAIVPGANITAVLTGQQLTRTALSDSTGFYNMLSMPPGVYEIATMSQGFEKQVQAGVRLTSGESLRVDVTLKVGSIQSEVSVTSTATLVNTTNQTLSGLVDDRRVQDLLSMAAILSPWRASCPASPMSMRRKK